MRVFFSIHSVAYLRLYESTIREMASRGHEIHLTMATSSDEKGWSPAIDTLRAEYPTITDSLLSPTMATFWTALAMTIRPWADYLRYLHPDYDSSPKLKARAAKRVPPRLVRLTNRFRGPGHIPLAPGRAAHVRAGTTARPGVRAGPARVAS